MATPPDSGAVASRRELAAIMFSDIAGYTAIMGHDEQEGLEARNSHRELLRAILPRFNGRLLGDLGDGALSSFHSAIDAVNCARAFQASTGSSPQFRIRIGIHVGDVLFADDTVVGDGVNIASRVQALAPPGGICISERVYEEIRNQRGMAVKSLGQKNLKNVSRPIGVYVLSDGADSSAAAKFPARTSRTKSRVIAMAGAGAIALAALAYVTLTRRSPTPNSTAPLASNSHVIRSIAVLPLDNYSGDPKQEYFADGMTDELTTDLATISQLRVISRGSVMQFKGDHRPPTPVIARLLNVDAVVEGSVLREGDKVRITAQLIDARADKHLWARSYERDSRDVLALQDELASAIAKEINVQLTPEEQARLSSAPIVNPQAHDAYLKGRYFINRPSDENLKKAIAQFEEAVRLDPNFAPAYSGLSDAYVWAGFNEGVFTAAEAMPKAKATAEKAIQLDDTSAEAHTSLAVLRTFLRIRLGGLRARISPRICAQSELRVRSRSVRVWACAAGTARRSGGRRQASDRTGPAVPEIAIDVATALAWQGNYEAARQQAAQGRRSGSDVLSPLFTVGWIDIEAGKINDAIPELQKADAMESPRVGCCVARLRLRRVRRPRPSDGRDCRAEQEVVARLR